MKSDIETLSLDEIETVAGGLWILCDEFWEPGPWTQFDPSSEN